MPRAFSLAQTGRSGAVLVDVPMDVFSAPVEAEVADARPAGPAFTRPIGDAEGVAAAAALLSARRAPGDLRRQRRHACPMRRQSSPSSRALLQAPVATTLMGKGLFPETDPLSVGTTGIWGTRAANDTTRDADVILAVGTAFGEADCSSWRPGVHVRDPGLEADPDRHRPGRDRQELSGRRRHRRRREGDAARADRPARRRRRGPRPRVARRSSDVAARKRDWQAEADGIAARRRHADPSGAPAARAVRGRARRRDLRHRRRLEQERRRPAAAGQAPALLHHQRRHGDDGLFARPPRSAPSSARPTAR